MVTVTAIVALFISLASLAFSVFQYRALQDIRTHEKVSALLRAAQDLRRKAHDLKHTIDVTDDVDDCAELLSKIEQFVEVQIPAFVRAKRHPLADLFKLEQGLLELDTEIELLLKQVQAVGRFNEEVREYEASKKVQSEL